MVDIKHTPGKWSINRDAEYCGSRIDGPDGRAVAHATQRDPHPTLGQGITQAEAEINAHLIAAAPELLEALQVMIGRIEYYISLKDDERPNIEQWEYTEGSTEMARARAAIAKATGA